MSSLSGIYYAVGGIGIGLGFLVTSQFLKVYTYIKKPVWLTPHYAEWVGAWWLVYAIGTCLSLILCLLLYCFDMRRFRLRLLSNKPRLSISNPVYDLIAPSMIDDTRISCTSSSMTDLSLNLNTTPDESLTTLPDIIPTTEHEEESSCKPKDFCLDIISLIKQLLFNLRYMGVTSCAVVEALLIKGYLAFLSKHIEYQFRTTSSHSSIYIGVISLFSVIFGAPLGAYFVKRFEMNGRQCAKFSCIVLAISSVFFLGLMLHCREPTIGTTHSMPVLFSTFDDPVTESDRAESPCKRQCRKEIVAQKHKDDPSFSRRMRYEHLSTCVRSSQSGNLSKSVPLGLSKDSQRQICWLRMSTAEQHCQCR